MKPNDRCYVRATLAGWLLLLCYMTGCAGGSKPVDLKLTCLESNATYSQHFDQAYVGRGPGGHTEVVLTDDHGTATGSSGAPAPVRQVMHVKVLWRPQSGTKQGHPSYTNAALRWYVLGENGHAAPDVLEYTGAGFVSVHETAGGTQIAIKNAALKPADRAKGSLNDPLGAVNLTGKFVARKSTRRVNELLAQLKNAVNGTSAQQASAN